MPSDTRRNQPPEVTESYRQWIRKGNTSYQHVLKEILRPNGLRADGRACDEQRKIYMKTGIVTQAKGSAYLELNKTKVIVSVFDPREIPKLSEFTPNGELYCEFKFAPFSCPERRGLIMDGEEKDLSVILRRALEPAVCRHEFPNFQVDIYALILDNDGSCLSAAITAAGLALADAGIPMYDLITSVTLVRSRLYGIFDKNFCFIVIFNSKVKGIHNDVVLVDPSLEEEKFCRTYYENKTNEIGIISLSYMPTLGQVTELTQVGCAKIGSVFKSMDTLISKCTKLSSLCQHCLVEDVKERLKENNTNDDKEMAVS